jgi:hypothetical protein
MQFFLWQACPVKFFEKDSAAHLTGVARGKSICLRMSAWVCG